MEVKGIEIVAGGLLGPNGAVVLDSIHDPSRLIGVAHRQGRIKRTPSPAEAVGTMSGIVMMPACRATTRRRIGY